MKYIFSIFSAIVVFSAQSASAKANQAAAPRQIGVPQNQTKFHQQTTPPPTYVNVKASIYKIEIGAPQADGTYKTTRTPICTVHFQAPIFAVHFQAPIFDMTNNPNQENVTGSGHCQAQLNGKDFDFYVDANGAIDNQIIHDDEPSVLVRTYFTNLFFGPKDGGLNDIPSVPWRTFMVRDLNSTTSTIINLSPENLITCKGNNQDSCTVNSPVSVSANVEFETP